MEEIAKAAEYATGTVYLYFKSKEELFLAIFEEKMRAMVTLVRQRAEAESDPVDALRAIVRAQLEFCDNNRTFFRLFLHTDMAEMTGSENGRCQCVRELYLGLIQFVEEGVKRGQRKGAFRKGDAGLYALAILGVLNMISRASLEAGTEKPLVDQADFIVELALNGIGK